jgi:hypothetical protein
MCQFFRKKMEVPPVESAEDALDTAEKLTEEHKYTGTEHRDPREMFTERFCERHSVMFAQLMNEICPTSPSSTSLSSKSGHVQVGHVQVIQATR